ncbi:MAG: DUF3048 domain-containing protein [Acidimicrobiia bacterium]
MPTRSRSTVPVLLAFLVALALVVGACSGGDSKEATATGEEVEAPAESSPTAPLTGLPDPDGEAASRPALSVKIDNNPDARPQNGLNQADIVWEEVVEGKATRFLAVFNSQSPETVGPIRSVRFTDPDLVWPLGGLFVYSGGVPEAVAALNAVPVQSVDENIEEPEMFRFGDRPAPHNLYGRPNELWKLAEDPAAPLPLLRYLEGDETFGNDGGTDVEAVTIDFDSIGGGYTATWMWDADAGQFVRSTEGEPQVDALDDSPLAFPNLIIQFIDYNGGAGVEGAKGTVVGSADAWVLSEGQLVMGTWSRADLDSQTEFRDANGELVKLPPGRTWITLPQIGSSVDVQAAAPTESPSPE